MSETTKSCPYCQSEIPANALACKFCGRDVHLFASLQSEVDRLTSENQLLQQKIHQFRMLGNALDAQNHDASENVSGVRFNYLPIWFSGLLTILAWSFLHWLLLFLYDVPLVIFRMITFLAPTLIGLFTVRGAKGFWVFEWLIALMTGSLSVFSMLCITHHIDDVPLLPQNQREWKEVLEYALSITLALMTGLLLWRANARWQLQQKKEALFRKNDKGEWVMGDFTKDLQNFATAVAPVVSGLMAIYAGLKSLFS
jgi:hypothetical protein